MSKFQIALREAQFGKINARTENHGEETKPATDIPIKFRGTKRDLDMFVPMQEGEKFSDLIYSSDGHCLIPHLSPLAIHRKPEGLNITIYDQATAKGKPMVFMKANAKNISVTLGKKHELEISLTLQVQVDPEAQAARLYRLMQQTREIKIESAQDDWLMDTDNDEEDADTDPDMFEDEEDIEDEDDK